MPEFNHPKKEITFKLVYYGPALSGKTTNLQKIHEAAALNSVGDLMTLNTEGDRTLFFDLLPVKLRTESGFSIKIKLFTVPGQVQHNSTRKIVLRGCDGIVFVADSQASCSRLNADALENLRQNLRELGRTLTDVPLVVQFNKRDLPGVVPEEMIRKSWGRSQYPVTLASAAKGAGVTETFEVLTERLYDSLDKKFELGRKFNLSRKEFLDAIHANFGNSHARGKSS
ncbi:MAG: Rab family GTPase [Bdellovibrionota bacterium]